MFPGISAFTSSVKGLLTFHFDLYYLVNDSQVQTFTSEPPFEHWVQLLIGHFCLIPLSTSSSSLKFLAHCYSRIPFTRKLLDPFVCPRFKCLPCLVNFKIILWIQTSGFLKSFQTLFYRIENLRVLQSYLNKMEVLPWQQNTGSDRQHVTV